MLPAIEITGLRVQRGGRTVLDGIDFAVPRGTVCGLLGPSGCGKTTLIRSIVGVQRIASGSVTVLGEPAGAASLRSRVSYVTQAPSIYGDLTVAANLRYFAAVLDVPAARGDEALAAVGLADRQHDVAGNLSGGQRGRVSLACALLSQPDLLVLDEPTVGLDPVLRRDLWQLFHDLAAARHDAADLQPRDGRGRAVRPPAADARRHADRRRGPRRPARAHGHARRRAGLPAPGGGMSVRGTTATARRVLAQLKGDPRTIALLLFVPCLLMTLLYWVYADQPETFDRVGLQLLGIFPFITMFLVTSVAMLRERTSGTLERLLTTPIGKGDLLVGYALAFGAAALVQATLASALALGVLGLDPDGSVALVLLLAVADAVLGMALGLLVSAFAKTEFQAVQFMPAFVLPQILLCGLIAPRDEMSGALEAISTALPMTYAVEAMTDLSAGIDLLVVAGSAAARPRARRRHAAPPQRLNLPPHPHPSPRKAPPMSRSLLLKITGGLTFAALLTALAIAVWPASNTDKARSDGEAMGTAVAVAADGATSQAEIDAALVDVRDAAADTRDHAGDAVGDQVDDQADALDRAADGAYGAATAGDEFSQEIYEWELEDALNDLNGNAEDFRTEGPEVQQAFWEGYRSTI